MTIMKKIGYQNRKLLPLRFFLKRREGGVDFPVVVTPEKYDQYQMGDMVDLHYHIGNSSHRIYFDE